VAVLDAPLASGEPLCRCHRGLVSESCWTSRGHVVEYNERYFPCYGDLS
jgi:hypothetical protein